MRRSAIFTLLFIVFFTSDANANSLGTAVVNTNVLTQFVYENNLIYIYNALSNEEEFKNSPEKWVFFYVPILLVPMQRSRNAVSHSQWLWRYQSKIGVKMFLGNDEISKLALAAIIKKYSAEQNKFAQFWDVAPLMIESLTAFIVETGTRSPIRGVNPYTLHHPNGLMLTATFTCFNSSLAKNVLQRILNEELEVEVAFNFAGFRQVSTNLVSMNRNKLKEIFTPTIGDGRGTTAQYIHRSQLDKFSEKYLTNLQMNIYLEDESAFGGSLYDQFHELFEQNILNPVEIDVNDQDRFQEIWSNEDLQPDELTSEINKVFEYNEENTKQRNDGQHYFTFNSQRASGSSGGVGIDIADIFSGKFSGSHGDASQFASKSHNIVSLEDIKNELRKFGSDVQWTGLKLTPKSFFVYKLSDIENELRGDLFTKQLVADKKKGVIIRAVIWSSDSINHLNYPKIIPGSIWLDTSLADPSLPWLLCDGRAVSRTRFHQLFQIVGVKYGKGDGKATFNLPDYRSRFPLGADYENVHSDIATDIGRVGGEISHVLTVEELPNHAHGVGDFQASLSGGHVHNLKDPGHNHRGATSTAWYSNGGNYRRGSGTNCWKYSEHSHPISKEVSNIRLLESGNHTHRLSGNTGYVGSNTPIQLVGPYQVMRYVVYSGHFL